MKKKLLGLLNVYEEEISLLLWTALLLFIIRSSGVILNNYAETAFLKRYGVEFIPIVNMANAVATLFITGLITVFLTRMSGARVLAYVFAASGLSVTLIRLLIPFGIDILYPILFMLKSQFELLQAMLFWNICNDLYNTRQSKRLFPLLTAGGVVGLILGSVGTPFFAKLFSLDNLLYLYLLTTLAGLLTVQAMGRNIATLIFKSKPGGPPPAKPSMVKEIKAVYPLIKNSILVKIVLVLTFMPNVVIPIMNYQFNYAVNDQFASEAAMIKFFGYFRGGLYTVSLFILLFVGRIYGRWGLPVALMFHPFNYIIAFMAFLFRFDVISAMYARMSTNIIRTTINVPANGILIGLFPQEYRNLIRPFLRGTVVRLALFLGSTLILISDQLFHPRYLTLVALPFMLAWLAAPVFLKFKYTTILKNLISNNLLDIKRFDRQELNQIFNQDKVIADLEASLSNARGEDAIWYARLMGNLAPDRLDQRILTVLPYQDEATQVALIKMISKNFRPRAAKRLLRILQKDRPEAAIAILKMVCQEGVDVSVRFDLTPYIQSSHPVVRGFAAACRYSRGAVAYGNLIRDWLNSKDPGQRQSGIICAGLSQDKSYIDPLLNILSEKNIDAIIPDIIIALSRLEPRELNPIVAGYLNYPVTAVRLAALDALKIDGDAPLKKAVARLADDAEEVRSFAKQKILDAEYMNTRLLVKALGTPGNRLRKGLFDILSTLDIRELDIFLFAKTQIKTCYDYLAMSRIIAEEGSCDTAELIVEHLLWRKELLLENIIRILAIQDKTGQMDTAWRGIFSTDSRQRANAIELLSDALDKPLFNRLAPLLECPTPERALAEGRKRVKILKTDKTGVAARLLRSANWVDIIMGLNLIGSDPSISNRKAMAEGVQHHINPHVAKEALMILKKLAPNSRKTADPLLSIGEKVLLLKEIDIFSGLSAGELAAIAAVTKERETLENEIVIRQGEVGETVYLLVAGKVEVIKEQEDGSSMVLDQIDSGGAFGEMALIDDTARSATIRTVEPCRFLMLHKQEFKETVMEFPRIALQICSVLSQRIRDLHKKFSQ